MARPRLKIQRWREIVRRDSQIFFILHLRFQSKLFWLSTDFLSIYSEYYGTSISAKPGVMTELNAERALDLLNRSGNIPNFDVEIWNEERFQELREYSPLTNADAEISLWAEGLTWEERLIAIDGKVRNPSWRTPSDPFKFTILSKRIFADQEFPPRTVDEVKWPNARSSAIGQPYPVIYGFRSVVRSLCVDVPNKKELISDYACYSSPSRIYLKGYDDISRQEVFYSDGSSLSVFETSGSTWSTAGGIISFTSIVDQVGLALSSTSTQKGSSRTTKWLGRGSASPSSREPNHGSDSSLDIRTPTIITRSRSGGTGTSERLTLDFGSDKAEHIRPRSSRGSGLSG